MSKCKFLPELMVVAAAGIMSMAFLSIGPFQDIAFAQGSTLPGIDTKPGELYRQESNSTLPGIDTKPGELYQEYDPFAFPGPDQLGQKGDKPDLTKPYDLFRDEAYAQNEANAGGNLSTPEEQGQNQTFSQVESSSTQIEELSSTVENARKAAEEGDMTDVIIQLQILQNQIDLIKQEANVLN